MSSRQLPPPPKLLEMGAQTPAWSRWFALLRDAVANPNTQALVTSLPSVPNGVGAQIHVFEAAPKVAYWLVAGNLGSVSNAAGYAALMLVATDASTAKIMWQSDGGLLALTMSGLIVFCTQNSGASQTVNCNVIRLL